MTSNIAITINGKSVALSTDTTLSDILPRYASPNARIAVERNAAIVPRSAWAQTALNHGDVVEILRFVGGG